MLSMFTYKVLSSNQGKICNQVKERQTALTMFDFALVSHSQDEQPMAFYCQPCPAGPVLANQWSELFAGFCFGWLTWLEGLPPPPPRTSDLLSLPPSVRVLRPACCTFCPGNSTTAEICAKGLTCAGNTNTTTSEQSWFSSHAKGIESRSEGLSGYCTCKLHLPPDHRLNSHSECYLLKNLLMPIKFVRGMSELKSAWSLTQFELLLRLRQLPETV